MRTALYTIATIFILVTSVAGSIYFLDDKYAPRDPTETRLAGLELKSLLYQLERIQAQITQLRIQRASVPPRVQRIIDGEIKRLIGQLENIQRQIDLVTRRR